MALLTCMTLAQQEIDLGEATRQANQALAAARGAYESADFSQAIVLLDRLVQDLGGGLPGTLPVEEEGVLTEALRLRGISYYNLGQMDAAEADFQRVLRLDPEHKLDAQLLSPKIVAAFEKVREQVTGLLIVKSDPPGARVFLGQSLVGATPLDGVRVATGRYLLRVEKSGYASSEQPIEVAAGQTRPVELTLVRTARSVSVMTVPSGARVLVDGKEAGVTSGVPPAGYHAGLVDRGLEPSRASAPLVLPLLQEGRHTLRVEKDCHASVEAVFNVDLDGGDLPMELEPIVLERSVAVASFVSEPAGAEVYLDGQRRGTTPLELRELCAGKVAVRMFRPGVGTWMGEIELSPGTRIEVAGTLRPTLVSLGAVRSLGEDDPEADRWDRFLSEVVRGQTEYNPVVDDGGRGTDPKSARLELFARIDSAPARAPVLGEGSRRGLADAYEGDLFLVAVPGGGPGATILLYGLQQGRPDVISIPSGGKESAAALAARLSAATQITHSWSGLIAVDTAEVSFPYVHEVWPSAAPGTTVRPGDRVRSVAGRPVTSRRDLEAAFSHRKPGEMVPVTVDRAGTTRNAEVVARETAVLPRPGDPELLVNKILADMASLRARSEDPRLRSLAALITGVAYLRAGEPELALSRGFLVADLPDGPGLSAGTVSYLRGLAMEMSGRDSQAAREAFAEASRAAQATLWRDDGPLVAPLAAARRARAQ